MFEKILFIREFSIFMAFFVDIFQWYENLIQFNTIIL